MSCAAQDADFLRRSLRGIKWIGTMRSRGFGRVKFSAEECEETNRREALPESRCIRYHLRTELPVLITDLARSYANGTAARTYLPGSAVRAWCSASWRHPIPSGLRIIRERASVLSNTVSWMRFLPHERCFSASCSGVLRRKGKR